MMRYKGYIGRVEIDEEAGLIHGEVINTRDVITFQGKAVAELKNAFHDSVDDYLAFCRQRGEQPDKPFSGRFVTRISPELHHRLNLAATVAGKSLNAWVEEQLQAGVAQVMPRTGSIGSVKGLLKSARKRPKDVDKPKQRRSRRTA